MMVGPVTEHIRVFDYFSFIEIVESDQDNYVQDEPQKYQMNIEHIRIYLGREYMDCFLIIFQLCNTGEI